MTIKLPSSLSFKASLRPTDAIFEQACAKTPTQARPLEIEERKNIGVMASMKIGQSDKSDKVMNPNPTFSQRAILAPDCDTLVVRFGLDVIGSTKTPHACNDSEFITLMADLHDAYDLAGGYRVLAERYVRNVAGATWLWRNADIAHDVTVEIASGSNSFAPITVNARDVPANLEQALDDKIGAELTPVITAVEKAFRDGGLESLEVVGHARVGFGREIYPSQVFPVKEDKGEDEKRDADDISRMLFHKIFQGRRQAAMHSEKVGAALRMIDTWHGGYNDEKTGVEIVPGDKAIVVNPYGQYRPAHMALRHGKKGAVSFRTVLMNSDDLTRALVETPEDAALMAQAHFLMANLVRGGVMGEKDA